MKIYFVSISYTDNGKTYYRILPHDLVGTIHLHFKFFDGWSSLIPFLRLCRITKRGAIRLKKRLEKKDEMYDNI